MNTDNKDYPSYYLLLIIAFLAGFVSLAYEIIATKVLYYFFNESTITTSSVISIFLFGIGLGSFIFSKLEKKIGDQKKLVLAAQLLIAVYAVFIFTNYDIVPSVFNLFHPFFGDTVAMLLLNKLIISFLYLIFPTILMGMVFPALIVMSISNIEQLPEKIGVIYSFDLFGAVLGALLSGFLFIPFFGIKALIFFAVTINLIIGLLLYLQRNKKFIFMILCFVVILPVFYLIINPFNGNATIYSDPESKEKYITQDNLLFKNKENPKYFQKIKVKEKIFFSHSPYGELSVFDEVFNNEQHRYLYIETRIQCSTADSGKKKSVKLISPMSP